MDNKQIKRCLTSSVGKCKFKTKSYYSHPSVWQHFKSDNRSIREEVKEPIQIFPLRIVHYSQPVWRAIPQYVVKIEMATYIFYDPETLEKFSQRHKKA